MTPDDAERLVTAHWGIEAEARPLPGDRDLNFRIDAPNGPRWVLKVVRDTESARADQEAQRTVLSLLRSEWPEAHAPFPRLIEPGAPGAPGSLGEEPEGPIVAKDGRGDPCLIRLVEFLPGSPLAEVRRRPDSIYRDLGHLLGRMHRILEPVPEDLGVRELDWDLRRARTAVERHRRLISDPERGAVIDRFRAWWERWEIDSLPQLPLALIHNDANDHNVLVDWGEGSTPVDRTPRISGLIDFGDMVRSWRVGELAVAGAYLVLDRPDPLPVLECLVRSYHRAAPLQEGELAALFPLLRLRLALSVSMSALQGGMRPDDPYVRISEAPAWEALALTEGIHAGLAEAHLRRAVGLDPSRRGVRVRRWFAESAPEPEPVLPGLDEVPVMTFDLTPGSSELADLPEGAPAESWTSVLFGVMERAGAGIGVGRYDEPRRWYSSPLFESEGNDGPLHRTVHLGIDLFAPAGTPVLAPLDGVVRSVADNRGSLDYGPTVILEHRVEDGDGPFTFHTLYGHLSRESVEGLEPGRRVEAGQAFAALGSEEENGGWAPHLHLQVVADRLGFEGEFPGVALSRDAEVWLSLSPDPAPLLPVAVPDPAGSPSLESGEIRDYRVRHLGPNLSLSYRRPLHIVRGWMQHLWDARGERFLDGVNNVAHVGHCHPRVTEALRRQAGVLNTNTRYLHQEIVGYVQDLLATFPEPLRVVYLVCSGSEANELALRLARAHTGRAGLVALESGYHGNTTLLVEASHYKNAGPGGTGAGDWVHTAPMPDPYRGLHRVGPDRTPGQVAQEYVGELEKLIARAEGSSRPVGAILAESVPGCAGQIVLPPGYLDGTYRAVRAAGGVCIADEVQVGFGRVGTHFWGFETQGVVPDIVTLGKPIGNGHPMGAVVTTEEIAASFDNGMEYFNTFGGNPVSCVVGRAVLEVIRDEGLQARALEVGGELRAGLEEVAARRPIIGEVRGLGLFLGIELVTDPEAKTPAGPHAAYVANRLRDRGILVSTDGPDHNVLKIKPPLQFSSADARRLVDSLDLILGEEPVLL